MTNATVPPPVPGEISSSTSGLSFWQKLKCWIFSADACKRLSNALPFIRNEVKYYEAHPPAGNWLEIANDNLVAIERSLAECYPEQGWKIYKELTRHILRADFAKRKKLCLNRARAILNESRRKMRADSWRRETIVESLTKVDSSDNTKRIFDDSIDVEAILYAAKLLDEHQDNFYARLRLFRKNIRILTLCAILGLLFWIMWAPDIGNFPYVKDIQNEVIEKQADAFWRAVHAKDSLNILQKDTTGQASQPPESAGQQTDQTKVDTTAQDPVETMAKPDTTKSSVTKKQDTITRGKDPQGKNKGTSNPPPTELGKSPEQQRDQVKNKPSDAKNDDKPWNKHSRVVTLWVILAGFIGSVVSGFLGSINTGTKSTIPNQMFGTAVMWAKLVLSMVSALGMYIILSTGVIMIFQGPISMELLLTFAFAAGFSERLIKKAVDNLTKEELYSGRKSDD